MRGGNGVRRGEKRRGEGKRRTLGKGEGGAHEKCEF